jgi:hypothetical protein
MPSQRTFDLKNMKVIVGVTQITGFGDGDSIRVERMSDTFTDSVGGDGEVERGKTNDYRGTITISVQQTSPTLKLLSDVMLADEVSNGGVVPIAVLDSVGFDAHIAAECWLVKPPAAVYGKEIGKNREWTFRAASLDMFFGGT